MTSDLQPVLGHDALNRSKSIGLCGSNLMGLCTYYAICFPCVQHGSPGTQLLILDRFICQVSIPWELLAFTSHGQIAAHSLVSGRERIETKEIPAMKRLAYIDCFSEHCTLVHVPEAGTQY
jgi:hypothetical protein